MTHFDRNRPMRSQEQRWMARRIQMTLLQRNTRIVTIEEIVYHITLGVESNSNLPVADGARKDQPLNFNPN
jgi:hypothetical protein